MDKGALELDSEELRFELDSETQLPTNLFKYESYSTNKLIEEFMLLANQAAAQLISSTFKKFAVLRHHPPPESEYLEELARLLECHGFTDFKYGTNKQLGECLDKVEKEDDPFFNRLVRIMATRCMNEARYFCTGEVKPKNFLHYGLAMPRYTHFTSPIRRYADVLVHRFLAAAVGLSALPPSLMDKKAVGLQVEKINYKHRMAQWADRASVDLHVYLYFKAHGKVVAEGVIMRVRDMGVQVAVEQYGAEGMVEMSPAEWLIIKQRQTVHGRPLSKYEGITMGVFGRIIVSIEAKKDARSRTLQMTFVSLPGAQPDEGGALDEPLESAGQPELVAASQEVVDS